MPCATPKMPANTASTVIASSTHDGHDDRAPAQGRSTSQPGTATTIAPPRATSKMMTMSFTEPDLVSVADTPDGDDPRRDRRVVLDLLPQPAHVDGHSGLIAEGPAPDRLQQLTRVETPGPDGA